MWQTDNITKMKYFYWWDILFFDDMCTVGRWSLPRDALQCKARYCDRMSSVCLSVCLSVRRSLFATLTWRVCSIGDIPLQIAAEWLHIAPRSQWRAYRKPPSLFRMVPLLTPYDLPFPKIGVLYAPNIRKWPYLCNGWSDPLHVLF